MRCESGKRLIIDYLRQYGGPLEDPFEHEASLEVIPCI